MSAHDFNLPVKFSLLPTQAKAMAHRLTQICTDYDRKEGLDPRVFLIRVNLEYLWAKISS